MKNLLLPFGKEIVHDSCRRGPCGNHDTYICFSMASFGGKSSVAKPELTRYSNCKPCTTSIRQVYCAFF
jgi:hypothetical protein